MTTAEPRTTVAEVPRLPAPCLPRDATVADVASELVREHVPALLLGDGAAIVSEHDVVRAVARGRDPDGPALAVATPDPIAVSRDDTVLEAVALMLRHGLRAVVVDDPGHRPELLTLATAVDATLAVATVPPWLAGLRVALRVRVDR